VNPSGFKTVKGDTEKWQQEKAIRWDYEHPEAMGYLKTSENGWEYQKDNGKILSVQADKENSLKKQQQQQKHSTGMKR